MARATAALTAYRGRVTASIDSAIAVTARQEFESLCGPLSRTNVARRIESALRELGKLRYGDMPDYDDRWVALLYVLWYQPAHINLAYGAAVQLLEGGDLLRRGAPTLSVVDFGAGCLAAQSGLLVALADPRYKKKSKGLSRIRIASIDSSRAMLDLGDRIWRRFADDAPSRALRKRDAVVRSKRVLDSDKVKIEGVTR